MVTVITCVILHHACVVFGVFPLGFAPLALPPCVLLVALRLPAVASDVFTVFIRPSGQAWGGGGRLLFAAAARGAELPRPLIAYSVCRHLSNVGVALRGRGPLY